MKKFVLAAAIAVAASGSVQAGGYLEPQMEPEVIVEESSSSSAGGIIVPLLLLLAVAAVAAN